MARTYEDADGWDHPYYRMFGPHDYSPMRRWLVTLFLHGPARPEPMATPRR